MGLDITAYENIRLLPEHPLKDTCWDQDHVLAFALEGFERSLRGLEAERCYETSGKTYGFRAGSYSGYSNFRDDLCRAVHGVAITAIWAEPERWHDAAFFELLNFADNEGTIGPEAAADLYQDFVRERARVRPQLPEGWPEMYDDWQAAFELAASTGLVRFH